MKTSTVRKIANATKFLTHSEVIEMVKRHAKLYSVSIEQAAEYISMVWSVQS